MGQIKDYLESKKKQGTARSLEELHAAARASVGNRSTGSVNTLGGADRERFDNDVRQNYAARQSASTAQKNTATVNQAAGKYYSQPTTDPTVNRLGNSLEVYKKNVEQKESALNIANVNAQRLYSTLKQLENQGARLGQYSTSKLAMAKLDEVKEQYQQTVRQYQQAAQQAQTAYAEYTPAWEQYAGAAKAFETSYAAQQKAYTDWKNTIRTDENAITSELEAAKKAAEALKERQKTVSQKRNSVTSIFETPNTSGFDVDPGLIQKRQEEETARREQTKQLTEELRKAEAEVERLQEELDWRKYFNYADLTENGDFAEKSQYKSTANGKRKVDAWGSFLTGDGGGLVFENSGYDDPLYDWINGDKEAGAALKLEAGETYGAEGGSAGRLWAYSTEGEQQASEMSEEERKIFNYLYATQGKEEAYQYYNQLRKDLNRRQRNTEQEKWAEYAKEHPVGASAFSVMVSPLKGLSYGAQAADYLTKGEIDQNAAYNKVSYIPSAIRGQVSQTAEDKWGPVGSFAYQTGMSMADFLCNSLLTGSFLGEGVLGKAGAKVANNLSLAIMGTGAAADATIEAKDRGLTDGQAFALGTVAGLAEVITEKVSVEALFNSNWEKDTLRYIIKNVVSEGSEEVGSDLINLFADVLISKDKSQWQAALEEYKTHGKTEEEAFWLAAKDQGLEMGADFLGGALSGGVMAGTGAAIGKAGAAISQRGEQRRTATEGENTVAEMNAGGYTEGNNIKQEGMTNGQRAESKEDFYRRGVAGGLPNLDGNEGRGTVQRVRDPAGTVAAGRDGTVEGKQVNRTAAHQPRVAEVTAEGSIVMPRGGETGKFYLPTAEQERVMRQAAKARNETERTGILAGASEEAVEQARRMGEVIGREVVFYSEASDSLGNLRNGFYDPTDGRIYVNTQSDNPLPQIVAHELTHSLEESGSYRDLERLVLKRLQQQGSLDALRQAYQDLYARSGVELDATGVDREIVAAYVEKHLLTNESEIRSVVSGNRTLGKRILTFLNQLLGKLGNEAAAERAFLLKARGIYEAALEESRTGAEELSRKNANRRGMEELREQLRRGEISEEEAEARFNDLYDPEEDLERRERGVRNSFGGEKARNADLDALEKAKEMQQQGVAEETIFRETGWYVGADGKWRFEIDDSGMEFRKDGDARLLEEDGYRRLQELTDKWQNSFADGEMLSEAEQAEMEQLQEEYSEAVREEKYRLTDFLKHDELFEQYPRLRGVSLVFDSLGDGERGYFSKRSNTIVLSDSLFGREADVLIHEIQHVLQRYEGFATGSSPAYWEKRMKEGYSKRDSHGIERMPSELYRNTAGEIEARDVTARRELSKEQRREKMPNRGNEDTVFAENVEWVRQSDYDVETASVKEQIENSREELNRMNVVAKASVPANLSNKAIAAKWAVEKLHSSGYKVDRKGFGEILFTKKDIDRGLRYADTPEEKAALAVLPQVLKRGILVGEHTNHKQRAKQTITFAAPVELNGIRGNMAVVVNKNGNHYYAHRIVTPNGTVFKFSEANKNTAQELSRGVTVSGSLADTTSAVSEDSIFSEAENVKQYSISPTFGEEIQDWFDGSSDGQRVFTLGSTGEVLQGLGAIESDIYMNGDKISTILSSHPEMTLREIQRIPEVLEDPVLVLASKNGNKRNSRLVLFGSLKAQDGRPVMCVLDLRPTENGLLLDDMQKVTSAYTKDTNPVGFIRDSEILFADKKRTASLLKSVGFWAPTELQQNGYIGSITYQKRSVKLDGVPFDRVVSTETGVFEPEYSNPAWREAVEAGREQRRKNSISVTEEARKEKAEQENRTEEKLEANPHSARERIPAKARGQMERTERALVNRIGKALGVPNFGQREYLKPIVQEISDEYLRTGQVSEKTAERLFDKAYSEGIVTEDEFYRQYKPVKDHLRTQAITISEQDKADIADWKEFRKSTFGTLRIVNKGGVPVDVAYQELVEMAPELFTESVTAPSDQLRKMFDVARSIQKTEVGLERYYGEDAANFAEWAKRDFEAHLGDAISELRQVKRYAEERNQNAEAKAKREAEVPTTTEEAMQAYGQLKKARWEAEKSKAKNLLTDHDRIQVGRLLKGEIESKHLNPETDNVKGIKAVYEASREYERLADVLLKYKKAQKLKRLDQADGYLTNAGLWKDKKSGILYARETMERNFEDVIGNPKEAKAVIREYVTPVHDMEAKATRYKTEYRDRVRELGLSRKVEKGNEISESHAVQELGEALDSIAMLENSRGRAETKDGLTLDEWHGVVTTLKADNPNMDWSKVNAAIEEFRKIYDEIFERMNQVRVENGYEPINYRRGYFPHFQAEEGEGVLKRFGLGLGIDTNVDSLPTTINGLTQNFKPGITWFGHAQERKGYRTTYDALQGFDQYIEGAASVIFQTENIQKLRALTSQIRYRTSDEGLRKQVDAVRADETLSEVDKENRIKAIYQEGKFELSNLVVELDEYTNILAGKKSSGDRNMERMLGRRMYRLMKSWESRVGANMIAGNLSSALTNFIPLTQAWAQIDSGTLLKGMWETLKSYKSDDGFADMSSFLTNRRGSDPVVKNWSQKVSEKLGKPMEFIDAFTSDSIVRARYAQNLKRGLSEAAAISEADAFAGKVMADRSKGSMPTLFSQSNPITKAFTQFQLEVNNQFSEVFKDLPKIYRDKGLKALAAALIKYFLGAFLFDEIYEFLVGRRPALDPIGILNDTVGDLTGYELPNLIELGTGAVSGELPSFQTEKVGPGEAGGNLAKNVLGELPFSSGLGLIGIETDGGRVPAASAVPDLTALWDAATTEGWNGKKRWKEVQDELNKLAYIIPPFGGNQVQKIVKSTKTLAQGGSYTVDPEGKDRLQYPVFANNAWQEAVDFSRMMAFGKNSLPEAQDWVENRFSTLSTKETMAYREMVEAGAGQKEAYDLLAAMKGKGTTNEKRTAIMGSTLTDEEKEIAYRYILGSKQEDGNYASSREDDILAFREVGLDFDQFLEVQNQYTDIGKEYQTAGEKAMAFSRWVNQQNYTAQQAETVRECIGYYSQMKAGTRYDNFVSAGLDDGTAYRLTTTLNALEPEDGKENVSNLQKYRAILDDGLSDTKTMTALSAVMPESEYAKLEVGNGFGVTAAAYVIFKEQLPQYDEDGNGSYSQEEVEKAIDSLGYRNGIMLPGGKKTAESIELTREEKAALWQMANKAWKGSSNPYNKKVGRKVYEALNAE